MQRVIISQGNPAFSIQHNKRQRMKRSNQKESQNHFNINGEVVLSRCFKCD